MIDAIFRFIERKRAEALRNEVHRFGVVSPKTIFFAHTSMEVDRARDLFPDSDGLMTALTEEVGEVAKAMLEESPDRVAAECVQVAAMAARLAEEMDPTLDAVRAKRGAQ